VLSHHIERLEQRALLSSGAEAPLWDPSLTEPWESLLLAPGEAGLDKGGVSSLWTVGTKRVLYIRVAYADNPSLEPQTLADAQSMLAAVGQYMTDNSWGALTLAPTITDLVVLPRSESWYISAGALALLQDARAAAAAASPSWNWTDYDLDIVRYRGGPGSFLGQAYIGGRGMWLKTSSAGVAAHELLHNLGLYHANLWQPAEPHTVVGPGTSVEYGDPFDIMGTALTKHHLNACYKNTLDWLPSSGVAVAAASGLYRIAAHDSGDAFDPNMQYALKIPLSAAPDYWVEFRQSPLLADNQWLMNGVLVRMTPWGQSNGGTSLLDTTPASPDGTNDAALAIGRTFSDPTTGVHITPLRKLPTVPPSVELYVQIGDVPGNRAPVVSLSPDAVSASVNAPVTFSAAAADPDGDALAYWWDFGDRSIGGNQDSVVHSFSAPGTYRVRVVVSDMKGMTASASVLVEVGRPEVASYRVSGRVLDVHGYPVADVCVSNGLPVGNASYRAAWTDSDGRYVLTDVPPGTCNLTAARAGWSVQPAGFQNAVSVGPGMPELDFRAEPRVYLVSGTVTADGTTPLAGALVSTAGIAEPTAAGGGYRMYLPVGTYTISVSRDGYGFQPATVCVRYGDVVRDLTATGYRVAGVITGAPDGLPITVTDGVRSVSVTSYGGMAVYQFASVPAGLRYITASAAGYAFSPVGWSNPLSVSADSGTVNFSARPAAAWTVRGRVVHLGEGLPGVTVSAGSASVLTDSNGGFALSGLTAGTWTITPSAPGRSFVPSSVQVTVTSADVSGVVFSTPDVDTPPVITSLPAAEVAGGCAYVQLAADDDRGAQYLTYTWSVVSAPAGAAVSFTANGSHSARSTTAVFTKAGTYILRAVVRDARDGSACADVSVSVQSRPAAVRITPPDASVMAGESLPFSAQVIDQFGQTMSNAPPVTWSVSSGGFIDQAGLFTAAADDVGLHTVTALCDGAVGIATVTVRYPAGPGTGITRQWWTGIPGTAVSALTSSGRFPGQPDGEEVISGAGAVFQSPSGWGDNYGQRMFGYFIAPTTGNYTFCIAADETAELWLSTDSNPAHRSLIASVPGAVAPEQWNKYPSQQSAPIYLLAGGRYYIEAIHKEASGADHLAVGVTLPGGIVERPIPAHRLSPFGVVTISGTPAGETIELAWDPSDPAVVRVAGGSAPQWTLYAPPVRRLVINAADGDDTLVVRLAPGAAVPSEGIFIDGGAGRDTLRIVGTPEGDMFRAEAGALLAGGLTLQYQDMESLRMDGGDGDDTLLITASPALPPLFCGGAGHDTLAVAGGAYEPESSFAPAMEGLALNVSGSAVVRLAGCWVFSSVNIADTARVSMPSGSAHTLRTGALNISASAAIDVGTGNLIVDDASGDPAAVLARLGELISAARNGSPSRWQGPGITSSVASADPFRGVAAVINSRNGLPLYETFGGRPVGPASILVAYALNGDADLNGVIDAADYFRIDQGFLNGGRSWADGDINYSGQVDADDYYLIDAAFLAQPQLIGASPPVGAYPLEPLDMPISALVSIPVPPLAQPRSSGQHGDEDDRRRLFACDGALL